MKDCKGCLTIDICGQIEKSHGHCPCKICIIKMICKKACDAYLSFTVYKISVKSMNNLRIKE